MFPMAVALAGGLLLSHGHVVGGVSAWGVGVCLRVRAGAAWPLQLSSRPMARTSYGSAQSLSAKPIQSTSGYTAVDSCHSHCHGVWSVMVALSWVAEVGLWPTTEQQLSGLTLECALACTHGVQELWVFYFLWCSKEGAEGSIRAAKVSRCHW